jgi:hypothetical protein
MATAEILAHFPKLSALVVGDICLDRWCTYDPAASEPSRETGIPRIGVVETEVTPGAGGTVANNLAALGAGTVGVLSALGQDGFGLELSQALASQGISLELCVRTPAMQTFAYTKVINARTGVEDQPRLDFINTRPLPYEVERQILDNLRMAAESFDVILIADQAETSQGGVVTPAVRDLLAELAPQYPGRIFFADSRLPGTVRPGGLSGSSGTRPIAADVHNARTRRRACSEAGLQCRADSPGFASRQPSGHLRSGRQLLRGRIAGPPRNRLARRGRALRQPGGVHYDHEEGNRDSFAGRSVGRPCKRNGPWRLTSAARSFRSPHSMASA